MSVIWGCWKQGWLFTSTLFLYIDNIIIVYSYLSNFNEILKQDVTLAFYDDIYYKRQVSSDHMSKEERSIAIWAESIYKIGFR